MPLIYDIDADPSEAYPLEEADLPVEGLLDSIEKAKAAAEQKADADVDPNGVGYEHALCCGLDARSRALVNVRMCRCLCCRRSVVERKA